MRIKIISIFILSILIPTTLLAYFGLLAVRSEKLIVEKNIQERYHAVADIVETEIKARLESIPPKLLEDREYLESIFLGSSAIFRDQVKILNEYARPIGGPEKSFSSGAKKKESEKPVLLRPIKDFSYQIAVYERHPLLLQRLEEKKKGLYLYVLLIGFSVIAILSGAFFTLYALSREWRLAKLKAEFVSHLSHDLRRPLTSIRMFSEMLKDDRIPEEEKKQEYYSIIAGESECLTHLANNILDFYRIEGSRKKYEFKDEDIVRIVTEIVERFRTYIADKSRNISLNIEDSIPMVHIDRDAISQGLMNLLSNADKYSQTDKEIKVRLYQGTGDRRQGAVVLEVIDHGIGIPQKEQKKIFKKFYRTSQKSVKDTEGTGLGLMLVKYIAEAHKGRVEVESEVGKGSKFSIILKV